MSDKAKLLFIHALSPIHVGTGQSLGAVDLSIARDRATGMPVLPGSGIKGALRDKATQQGSQEVVKMFGPETENASDHGGGIAFGDGNLLFLPVRSIAGTFAWVTSELLLRRFARDCAEVGEKLDLGGLRFPSTVGTCLVSKSTRLKAEPGEGGRVVFEDLDFKSDVADGAGKFAARLAKTLGLETLSFAERFCVVHDDVMSFLAQHATDVVTRVSIERDTRTAKKGQLWTEESLPAESLLYGVVAAQPNKKTGTPAELFKGLARVVSEGATQFGGKSTVGRGRVRLALVDTIAEAA
jgi:CRISPR-associated protein Cmr4